MIVNFLTETPTLDSRGLSKATALPLDRVAVIILAGGEGKRLVPLTRFRCKPAVSFGGRFTLVDVPISQALSTGLKKIFVVGQYLATTLQRHLFQTYFHHGIAQNNLQMLVPEERDGKMTWYKGTADAVRQNLRYISDIPADYFLILSGDQLYNINFQEMIQCGLESKASMMIAVQPVAEKEAMRMGLLKIEPGGTRIIDFTEKPKEKAQLEAFYTAPATLHRLGYDSYNGKHYLGSMGIYFFRRQALFDLLAEDSREDFGMHLIQTQVKKDNVHAYLYDGYWEDIGTIESYYHANLALTRNSDDNKTGFQLYNEKNPLFSTANSLPGAKVSGTKIDRCLLCEGSIISAAEITHSVIGIRSVIRQETIIRESVLMGNEYYEPPELESGKTRLKPGIGENCLICNTIIDENVTIGNNVKLVNASHLTNYDSKPGEPELYVRDGIIIVPRGTSLPDNYTF